MPLASGYGRYTIARNVEALQKEGYPRAQALAIANAHARVDYFRRFPHGALPRFLAYPKTHPLKHHYDRHGKPLHAVEENPSPPVSRSAIDAARRLGKAFSGHDFNRAVRMVRKPPSGPRLAIGPVSGIMYLAKRDGQVKEYLHRFAPRSRPLLATTSDGTTLELLGGAFRFTDRGIVDTPPRKVKRKG